MNNSEIFIDNSETSQDDISCVLCVQNIKIKDLPKIVNKAL